MKLATCVGILAVCLVSVVIALPNAKAVQYKPDLVPVNYDASCTFYQTATKIHFKVYNGGDANAGHFDVLITTYKEQMGHRVIASASKSFAGLNWGQYAIGNVSIAATEYDHAIGSNVDYNYEVDEWNENNNLKLEHGWCWGTPP